MKATNRTYTINGKKFRVYILQGCRRCTYFIFFAHRNKRYIIAKKDFDKL